MLASRTLHTISFSYGCVPIRRDTLFYYVWFAAAHLFTERAAQPSRKLLFCCCTARNNPVRANHSTRHLSLVFQRLFSTKISSIYCTVRFHFPCLLLHRSEQPATYPLFVVTRSLRYFDWSAPPSVSPYRNCCKDCFKCRPQTHPPLFVTICRPLYCRPELAA